MRRFQKGYPRFASRKSPSAKDVLKPRTDDLKSSEIDRWKIDRSISPRMKILVNSHSIARKLSGGPCWAVLSNEQMSI